MSEKCIGCMCMVVLVRMVVRVSFFVCVYA